MTGLDLSIDELVEVSVVITDSELTPMDEGIDILIKPSQAAVDHMGDFVRAMHTNSGLITEWENGLSLEEATARILAYIKKHVPEAGKAPLGGNSVGTDKMFLEKYMPSVVEYLHYRIIDVSSIKELAKRWYPRAYFASPEKKGNHRALGDIYDSIDELRYYRAALLPEGEGPTTEECVRAAQSAVGVTSALAHGDDPHTRN
ncbi:MAG: oligoribonuclease [Ancrocorticia sp.]|jgi:oligoribonuclease|nr:oligoribonuclease [Ancrocorticia sp.]MCI1896496.1 oligoribonuclease [Ancrocorticia sp.]MCI1964025.1 oligoribonuclease [Ancrocorticia sp.]MCI2001709.1 oligoribonuclease [Ancrocorticia sp.]MCI2012995.1 oligoribonuclease [Ancrocorticia sp.]